MVLENPGDNLDDWRMEGVLECDILQMQGHPLNELLDEVHHVTLFPHVAYSVQLTQHQ